MTTPRRTLAPCAAAAALALLAGAPAPAPAQTVDPAPYAWQFPEVHGIGGADDLLADLRAEVQRVLDAGVALAPLYVSMADQVPRGYKLYMEPGRMLTTLAWAWPYMNPAQQAAARNHVSALLADATYAPWAPYPVPPGAGARRERHPPAQLWSLDSDFGLKRPSVQTLYGVWLWAWRSGDASTVLARWSQAKSMYAQRKGQAELYGTMGAHVAEARLAQLAADDAERDAAYTNLQQQLNDGLTFDTIEQRAWNKTPYWDSPYRDMYDDAMVSTNYRGWVFLNLTPEIGRYLAEHVSGPVLARHQQGLAMFPLWWLYQAPYFVRGRTGDEGIGLTPEEIGMLAPVARWVAGADAEWLAQPARSVPTGRGDCYWIEALVQAIEARGTLAWRDVRRPFETGADAASALRWTDRTTLAWGAAQGAASYRVYRGDRADLPHLDDGTPNACLAWSGSGTTTGPVLTEGPAAGALHWVLVVAVNAYGEGGAGRSSAGERVINSRGTCP